MTRETGLGAPDAARRLAAGPGDPAAAAAVSRVGLRISPAADGERPWPIWPGSPMLAETVRRCADTGIKVLDVEAVPARGASGRLHGDAGVGGRARGPVRERDLRRPRPRAAVGFVRDADRGGGGVRHSRGGRVHGLPERPHPGGGGGDRGWLGRWRRAGGRAARPAVRGAAGGPAGGGPGVDQLRAGVRHAAGGAGGGVVARAWRGAEGRGAGAERGRRWRRRRRRRGRRCRAWLPLRELREGASRAGSRSRSRRRGRGTAAAVSAGAAVAAGSRV